MVISLFQEEVVAFYHGNELKKKVSSSVNGSRGREEKGVPWRWRQCGQGCHQLTIMVILERLKIVRKYCYYCHIT